MAGGLLVNKFILENATTSYDGFQELLRLKNALESAIEVGDKNFFLDMSRLTWFEGNLCACLGGLLTYFKSQGLGISTKLSEIEHGVLSLFNKNGFLALFGQDRTIDTYSTTIEFKKHKINGSDDFQTYIRKSFSPGSKGLPNMTPRLLKRFRNHLYEIYLNAIEHAETQQAIFSCGQFFPRKQRLDFCITDLGIGIKENIKRKIFLRLKPEEAIDWAMQAANTTRKGESGGLGLKLIREFIMRNNGRIAIVSDAGYWELKGGQVTKKRFDDPFPGTVVLIEINTADTKSYALKSEIDPNDIF
jgi:signal transduction histidine kinase